MKKQFKFNELTDKAKKYAVNEYLKGWEETHEKNDISFKDAYAILLIDLIDESFYTKKGEYIENE